MGSAELPTWSLDGEEIAYICGCGQFRAIKPDGTGDRLIWDPDPGATGGPDRIGSVEGARISFSPDGSRLAVAVSPSGTGPPVEIWTVGRDGGNPTRLTTGAIDQNVDFSPDGKKIVFNRTAGVTTQIWVMNADGSGQTPIKSGPSDVTPDFSPDGRKIVSARITGNESQLFTMNADGTGQTPLGTTGSQPAWAEDRLVRLRRRAQNDTLRSRCITERERRSGRDRRVRASCRSIDPLGRSGRVVVR